MATKITPRQVKKAIRDFPVRMKALQSAEGGHFEPSLKAFKREQNKRCSLCAHCQENHCHCETCQVMCEAATRRA